MVALVQTEVFVKVSVLTRPAMEAGESIGYLPGSLQEKMAPYLRPLFDALSDRLGSKHLGKLIADGPRDDVLKRLQQNKNATAQQLKGVG